MYVTKAKEQRLAGVVVGKRIACAAQRVRGRRIMREAVRRLMPWVKDNVWFVVSLKESGIGAGAREIYYDLAACMQRRGLLVKEWPGADWDVDSKRG